MSKYKQSPFHNRQIIKGEYGELSKIEEELDEARDAAEQGILDRFSGCEVEPQCPFAENLCWRNENELEGLKTLMFLFCR